jgi:hypothetical protein
LGEITVGYMCVEVQFGIKLYITVFGSVHTSYRRIPYFISIIKTFVFLVKAITLVFLLFNVMKLAVHHQVQYQIAPEFNHKGNLIIIIIPKYIVLSIEYYPCIYIQVLHVVAFIQVLLTKPAAHIKLHGISGLPGSNVVPLGEWFPMFEGGRYPHLQNHTVHYNTHTPSNAVSYSRRPDSSVTQSVKSPILT